MYKREVERERRREKIADRKIYVEDYYETQGREKLREKARQIHWDGDKE